VTRRDSACRAKGEPFAPDTIREGITRLGLMLKEMMHKPVSMK
jgi:hypothetical protein